MDAWLGFPNSSPASLWPHHALSLKGPPSNAVLSERRPSPFFSSLPRMHGRCFLHALSGKRATGARQEHHPVSAPEEPATTLPCQTGKNGFPSTPLPVLPSCPSMSSASFKVQVALSRPPPARRPCLTARLFLSNSHQLHSRRLPATLGNRLKKKPPLERGGFKFTRK